MKNKGIHIIADLYDCDFSYQIEKHSLESIVEQVKSIVSDGGFTILGTLHHSFGKNAFSIVCMLAESHISIHTWPERGYVSFDIHTCNYTLDNTSGTERIYDKLTRMFDPKEVKKDVIVRSMNER